MIHKVRNRSTSAQITDLALCVLVALLLLCLIPNAMAQADIRPWLQGGCDIDSVEGGGNGLLQAGDSMAINSEIPEPGDFTGTQQTEDGTSGFFDTPGAVTGIYTRQAGGQFLTTAEPKLQALQNGNPGKFDVLAIGGFGTVDNSGIDGWQITGFSFELADTSGEATDDVEQWPLDLSGFDLSQCGVDFQNTDTLETARATGTVAQIQNPVPKRLVIHVQRGDVAGLIEAVEKTNAHPSDLPTPRIEFTGPDKDFVFTEVWPGSVAALHITRSVEMVGPAVLRKGDTEEYISFVTVGSGVKLKMINDSSGLARISDFSRNTSGGAVSVGYKGVFSVKGFTFSGNQAGTFGGAIHAHTGNLEIIDCTFFNNKAGNRGGAIHFLDANGLVENTIFSLNDADDEGCDVATSFTEESRRNVNLRGSIFWASNCKSSRNVVDSSNDFPSRFRLEFNDSVVSQTEPEQDLFKVIYDMERTPLPEFRLNTLGGPLAGPNQQSVFQAESGKPPVAKPEQICEAANPDSIVSLGYNIASDDSCSLDQPTDLPNTDPLMSEPDEKGIRTPLPGSPAIDFGPSELVMFDGDEMPSLPCGWRDIKGQGRPQDADGDGEFQCDAGAVEVQGAGQVHAGHSGAFYNALRNNEGQFVEIISADRALIYTFSYNPDGSGPAWFLGDAKIVGNSLVTQTMFRPIGTSFGDAFDAEEVDFNPWGGMSMVFPGCSVQDPAGNSAYSGSVEQDYEPLLTKVQRLAEIAGCDSDTTPHPNAGLSGSFFDPLRSGEGVIVEWLPDGQVIIVMFTYDLNGEQMWLFGLGQSNGKSVTIDMVYPAASTSWGSSFDNSEISLLPWGTITMSWTDCGNAVFEYDSIVAGYGSAVRDYTRLTMLMGLSCPP